MLVKRALPSMAGATGRRTYQYQRRRWDSVVNVASDYLCWNRCSIFNSLVGMDEFTAIEISIIEYFPWRKPNKSAIWRLILTSTATGRPRIWFGRHAVTGSRVPAKWKLGQVVEMQVTFQCICLYKIRVYCVTIEVWVAGKNMLV